MKDDINGKGQKGLGQIILNISFNLLGVPVG